MSDERKSLPLLGDRFPQLNVQSTHGEISLPDDMKGSWFVLFSHPGDFTPVCTTEFVAFQNKYADFDKLDCKLIGLSVDQVFCHIKWVQWIKKHLGVEIQFPVIAANDKIANSLGMLHPEKGNNTVRAVFIVDASGIVRVMLYYPQEIGRNIDEILRAVKALQVSDAQGAMPANWPDNELIGDQVIVPPAKDEETAGRRLDEYQGYDWWFCYKPLEK